VANEWPFRGRTRCVTIGARIRDLRVERGWSQAELAAELCKLSPHVAVTRESVSRWEAGRREPRPYSLRNLAAVLGVDVEDLLPVNRREFVAAAAVVPVTMRDAPRRVGTSDVSGLRARFARLRSLDNLAGGADTYRLFVGELARTQQLLSDAAYSDSVSRALVHLASEQAQQAAWAEFDAGKIVPSLQLYDFSHRAALEVGDRPLSANALIQVAYATESARAVASAEAACAAVGAAAPAQTRALLQSRLAWSFAVTGKPGKAVCSLRSAREALASAGGARAPEWSAWVDETELGIMEGRVWAVLHEPQRAIPVLESVLRTYPDHWSRDKALYMTWLADAYLDVGEADQVASITSDAVALAASVASVRPKARAGEVAKRLAGLSARHGAKLIERVEAITPPIPARL
jgi:DNA-binding XRE family transcriptional regulator